MMRARKWCTRLWLKFKREEDLSIFGEILQLFVRLFIFVSYLLISDWMLLTATVLRNFFKTNLLNWLFLMPVT